MRAAIALAIAALLFAAPVAAEIFVVKLTNGNEFETRYRPREAGWDPAKVVLVTDVGNPIALAKASIVSVIGRSEDRGFGRVIDNTTFELGLAPNDAPDAEEGAPADQVQAFVDALQQSQGQPVNYNVQQFAEPSATGGLPVNWVAPPPTPPTGTVVFQGTQSPPPPPPEQ